MRRRIVIAMVATVVVALVLAGLGTLLLSRFGARRYTEVELRRQVEVITTSLPPGPTLRLGANADQPRYLAALRAALRLEGVAVVTIREDGTVAGRLPDDVVIGGDEIERLRAGETVSGHRRGMVYAAAPLEAATASAVLVLSDRSGIALGGAVPWFLLAATGTVLIAVLVATRLSQTLTEPLRRADAASRRITAGDLAVRVPEPPANAHDELSDLSRSINAMAAALERSRGLERQFLLSVSHDLRTPLTSIQGYAEALADGTAPESARAGEVILSESRRLERLVRDLLDLARLDARQFSFDPMVIDAGDLVEACIEGFEPEARAAALSLDIATVGATVRVDPDRLAQVVANLMENALKYARHRIAVAVSVSRDGDFVRGGNGVRISVEDDGPGIDPADLPHVFERLYVSRHRPIRKESGSGLGLAIVRELVTAMGGAVGAEPGTLGGARLWIAFPAVGTRDEYKTDVS